MKEKMSKTCESCKNKCKIYSSIKFEVFCNKYVKEVNQQLKFKIKGV